MQSLWMLVASFFFAMMGVCVKLASQLYSINEVVMYRGFIGLVCTLAIMKIQGVNWRTTVPFHHLWRGVFGAITLWLWYYSMAKLPLATAITLNYTSPIWIATILLLSGFLRGDGKFDWRLVLPIVMSFIGVAILLQPNVSGENLFVEFVALISGLFAAIAFLQVRRLGGMGEPDNRVVFYFSAVATLVGFAGAIIEQSVDVFSLPVWRPHTIRGAILLLGVGVSATLAQIALTRAFRLGKTLVASNLQYFGIVFSSIFGILIWHDHLEAAGWLGMSMIVVSGIASAILGGAPKHSGLGAAGKLRRALET
jgi:S-adenosylmethionine uptake transporter